MRISDGSSDVCSSDLTVTEWQVRPLDACYPLVFFDAIRVKIRDEGFVQNKAVYIALGILPGYCGSQGGGPLGESELILTDDNGDQHRFYFETFFNRYDAQTLGIYLKPDLRVIAA